MTPGLAAAGAFKHRASMALDLAAAGLGARCVRATRATGLAGDAGLQVRARPARMGRNPATGEAIKIKASKKVAFRVAKDLKEAI